MGKDAEQVENGVATRLKPQLKPDVSLSVDAFCSLTDRSTEGNKPFFFA